MAELRRLGGEFHVAVARYFPIAKPGPKRPLRACSSKLCGACPSCRTRAAWARGAFAGRTRRKPIREDCWTGEEDLRLSELAGHVPAPELAARLSGEFCATRPRTTAAVRIRAKRLGLSLWMRDLSMRELCDLFGTSHRTIRKHWLASGLLVGTHWARRGANEGWRFARRDVEAFVRRAPWLYDRRRMAPGPLRELAELVWRGDPYLDYAELERALGLSSTQLDKWRRRGLIPHIRRPDKGGLAEGRILVRRRDVPAIQAAIEDARAAMRRAGRANSLATRRRRAIERRRAA